MGGGDDIVYTPSDFQMTMRKIVANDEMTDELEKRLIISGDYR